MAKITVDLENREKLRRLHTATHILNNSARKVLGNHIWQNGSNLKPEFGSLDITHYDNLSKYEIYKIEKLVNNIIFENKSVSIEELERSDAEKEYGFSLYQGGAIPMKKLRVVKVDSSDIEACGGIHMQQTGGIGLFKIIETQKIQDGVVRIKYVVREFALDFINSKQDILSNISKIYNVDEASIVKTSEKFFNELKEHKKEIENLKSQLKTTYINSIFESNLNEFKIKSNSDMGFLMEIFTSVLSKKQSFKLISNKFIIATSDIEVLEFKKVIDKKKFKIYIL